MKRRSRRRHPRPIRLQLSRTRAIENPEATSRADSRSSAPEPRKSEPGTVPGSFRDATAYQPLQSRARDFENRSGAQLLSSTSGGAANPVLDPSTIARLERPEVRHMALSGEPRHAYSQCATHYRLPLPSPCPAWRSSPDATSTRQSRSSLDPDASSALTTCVSALGA